MQLVEIEEGQVTVTLDYTDCYAIAQGLLEAGGCMAGSDSRLYQVYEAMSTAFLAAAALGHTHAKVIDQHDFSLSMLQSEYQRKRGNV